MSKNKQSVMFFAYVKDFINDMRIELKSERTVETYRDSLYSFRKYIFERYSKGVELITVEYVTDELIREYIGWIAEHNSIGTRNIRLAAIKAYVRYISSKNIDIVPLQISIASLKHKKIYPKRNNWLSKEQVLLLLDQPNDTKIGVRDRFIMLFLFVTGARLNEINKVKLKDIVTDGEYPYSRVMGKGNKPRIVPLSDDTFLANFNYYCSLFHSDNNPDEYLFYTINHGCRNEMSVDNIQRILKKYGNAARRIDSTIPSVHPHLLRHSYGAQLHRLGLSLPEIAKLLGHADISTTEIYAEPNIEMTTEALKRMLGKQPVRKWDGLSEDEKCKILGLR